MLPQRRNEAPDGGDEPRAGFEVHVIGGTRPVPPPDGGKQRLEIGLQIGTGHTTSKPDRQTSGPVHRLEADDAEEPLRARSMSELGPAEPYVPRGARKKRSMTVWTAWMAVGTCTLVIAAVAGVMAMRSNQAKAPESAITFAPEESFGAEKAYFLANTPSLTREAEALLKQYAAATSPEQVLPLVRDAPRVKERLMALWRPLGSLSQNVPLQSLISDSEIRPALLLVGQKADFTRLEMIFVREDGHLKIDWEASYGIGDAQLSELRESKTVLNGVKVRVVVEPGSFYTPEFPEAEFRSYQLLDASKEIFIWGFARRTSGTADLLEAEFNEGSVLLERVSALPATLRVSGPLHKDVNLFEITEMLHKGWVSP